MCLHPYEPKSHEGPQRLVQSGLYPRQLADLEPYSVRYYAYIELIMRLKAIVEDEA